MAKLFLELYSFSEKEERKALQELKAIIRSSGEKDIKVMMRDRKIIISCVRKL